MRTCSESRVPITEFGEYAEMQWDLEPSSPHSQNDSMTAYSHKRQRSVNALAHASLNAVAQATSGCKRGLGRRKA